MSSGVTYYNEEYAPCNDDYEAAREYDNQRAQRDAENQRSRNQITRNSKYDENMYSLPNIEDDDGPEPPPPTQNSSQQRKLMIWKGVAILSFVMGIVGVGVVVTYFVYLDPDTKGESPKTF